MTRPAAGTQLGTDLGTGMRAYGRLLRYPPAARPFLAAVVARLPIAMGPLSILLLVERERGLYSLAGFVTGAFALGSAFGMPVWGRLMDRFGQPRVLVPTSLVSATAMVAIAVATLAGGEAWLLLLLALLTGLSFPPMSAAMRASWRVIFPDRASRRVAFALDGTAVELIFVLGPLLLSLFLLLTPSGVPLVVTAVLLASGAILYSRTDAAQRSRGVAAERTPAPAPATGRRRPRREPPVVFVGGVATVLGCILMLSIGFGHLDTSMAATSGQLLGSTDNVGVFFAAIAGGSTIGGLTYGARRWGFAERRGVVVLLLAFSGLLACVAWAMSRPEPQLGVVLGLLFVTGLTIAPALIMQQQLVDQLAPAHRLNEAQSFFSAANTTGAAAGTALAGIIIDFVGIDWSYGAASIALALAAVVAVISQRRWRQAAEADVAEAASVPAHG